MVQMPVAHAGTLPVEKPPIFINFCEDAVTPADMQACTQKRFANAEDMLNKQFASLLRLFANTEHLENLQMTQNQWIHYRDMECAFEASFFEEGIARRTLELSCLSRLSEDRALLLFNFIPRTRIQNIKNENKEEK